MMLHLPADAPECSREIAAQLKRILDVYTSTLPQPEAENWNLSFDASEGESEYAVWGYWGEEGRKEGKSLSEWRDSVKEKR